MAAKEIKKATENLTCPVCIEVFKHPKYLPCYHSYCKDCLEKLQKQSKITCPECRKEAPVPTGGVKDLPSNFLINRLVDEFILKRKVEGEEEVKCDLCDEDDLVVSYCPDCGIFLCHICNESHKRHKRSRAHKIVPLAELSSNKDIPLQVKAEIPTCKEHDYELKHYCDTCDELVCLYCTMKKHNTHNHDTVKQMAYRHRSELKQITAPLDEMITGLAKAHDNIDKMGVKIKSQGSEVKKEIDQHYDELIRKLMEQKDEIKRQVDDAISQKGKAVGVQLEEVECAQTDVLSVKELKDAVERGNDQEALSAKEQVCNRMQKITEKYNSVCVQPVQSATMEFVPTNAVLPQFGQLFTHVDPLACEVNRLSQSLGRRLELSAITKYHNGHHCSVGGSDVSVQLEYPNGKVTTAQVIDNNNGCYTASCVSQQVGEVKLFVAINGQPIKGNPYIMIVLHDYTTIDKPCKLVSNDGMESPWGIAFNKNGMWAVTDKIKQCVYVYDGEDELINTFGGSEQFRDPAGIAFDSDDHIYVVDRGNKTVKKFQMDGTFVLQLDGQDTHLSDPVGITVYKGKVYVAEYCDSRVSVFQSNGQFCCAIGKGQLRFAYDVTVTIGNHLLVSGWVDGNIHDVTLDGKYIGKFGVYGSGKGELHCPSSLTTDLNGFILVAEHFNHRVSIFDLSGKFVHCFGSEGSDIGQFQRPIGIALAPSGKIYVCDTGNKRIQIFF